MKNVLQMILFMLPCAAFSQIVSIVNYNEANTLQFAGSSNAFRCIGIGDSVYWAGTQYKGLYKYDTAIKVWVKSTQLPNVFINDIKRDNKGGVWIAQSGTSGNVGGGSNIAGGINYFPSQYDFQMQFYSVPGTTTGGGVVSRNMRSIFISQEKNTLAFADTTLPKVWAASATYITSGNTTTGGLNIGLRAVPNYFVSRKDGLQLPPFNGSFPAGTPSCDAIGGDDKEVWVSVRQNFGRSQIIRYRPSSLLVFGTVLGKYDNTTHPGLFTNNFRAQAICFDSDGRRWIGLQFGGLVVQDGGQWSAVNSTIMPTKLTPATVVNNNAITEDGLGNVYIGTSTGLLIFDGGGAVTDSTRYTRYTTANGLPSDNITGVAYDTAKGRLLIASDGGISFMTIRNPIDVSMEWDRSFPEIYRKPKGVVADGVSRILLRIKNGDPNLPPIKNVEVSIDNYVASDSSQRGKLKRATAANLNVYSEEANTGTDKLVYTETETRPGEFWFWYVAPTDFSSDSSGTNANLATRSDNIKIKVTYTNNATDQRIFKDLRVVRPPLLLVHGLADGPKTWNVFKHDNNIPFITSSRFKYVHALTMNSRGSFAENANLLVSGDRGAGAGDALLNTLQGNIQEIRTTGYACNQVDYVCHSMGGIMIRYAIEKFAPKFYVGQGSAYKYKNYGKGFTHKIITINTPHNSSPIADGVYDYVPSLPKQFNKGLGYLFIAAQLAGKDLKQPFDFIEPVDINKLYTREGTSFRATPAITNLKVKDDGGGINLAATNAKFHMITSNVNILSEQTTATMAAFDPTLKYVTNIIQGMMDNKYVPDAVKKRVLRRALFAVNTARIFTFFEWYNKNLGFPDFLANSDLIVPLASENARVPLPGAKPYITNFINSPGSYLDASHVTILGRKDVGHKVFNLLNSRLYGPLFGNQIPANVDPEPSPVLQARQQQPVAPAQTLDTNTDSLYYDTTRIVIDSPSHNSNGFADSSYVVQFRIKDTTNIAYLQVHFQTTDTFVVYSPASKIVRINMPVIPDLSGSQTLWAMAAYFRPDNGIKYYLDTLDVLVKVEAALGGFRVNDSNIVISSRPYFPPYQVSYRDQVWVGLPNNDSTVTVTFDPPNIVYFDTITKALTAKAEGSTTAVFSYKGINDTIPLTAVLPIDSFAIARTIAAGSFKNPQIWKGGRLPNRYDSVVIQNNVTLDSSITVGSIRINAGASLTLNNASVNIIAGDSILRNSTIDNYGSLNIQSGTLNVLGQLHLRTASSFSMTGGKILINGNAGGVADFSVPNGASLFQADSAMASFSFTGGTLQITDPPAGNLSQSVQAPYDFGPNSTLIFGDGLSAIPSKNTDGFGGLKFPNKIGKLIVNASTKNGNRQFVNKKALTVKTSTEVKTGSSVILQAPLNVQQ